MKQHLNTLYVTTEGAYLGKDGAAIAVKVDKKVKLRLPLLNLDGIVCFGRVGASPALMAACAEAGVSISFLTTYGKLQARVLGFTSGNVLLRRQQYRMSDSHEDSLRIAKSFVLGKIANCRSVLMRSARDVSDESKVSNLRRAVDQLKDRLQSASTAVDLDTLRAREAQYIIPVMDENCVEYKRIMAQLINTRNPINTGANINKAISDCWLILSVHCSLLLATADNLG